VPWPLGIVDVALAPTRPPLAALRAAGLGFDHVDLSVPWRASLCLPVGDRVSLVPLAGHSCPAPPDEPGAWQRAVRAYRRTPGLRVEPWPGSILGSVAAVRAMADEVPGLRLLLDTGHVASWGEDPAELADLAHHVQLRQAREGVAQCADGDVDVPALLRRLHHVGYEGRLSVEYFDLPEYGWPLDDPLGHAVDLARRVRAAQ